jgi:DnaA family protein
MPPVRQPTLPAMQQLPLVLSTEPVYRYDNFVVNAASALVVQALQARTSAAAIYLWGPSGCGKTHLLHAAAQAVQQGGGRVQAFGAADAAPWQLDEVPQLVLLDDCDRYDAQQQHGAFQCFVEAATHGFAVLAAARMPPVDLPVREDLRTRLGWGVVYQLDAPGEDQVRALLRREADRRGIFLSDEVMGFVMTRFERNLSHLMRLLDRLDRYGLAHHREVTVPMIRRMLAEQEEA